MVESAGICQNRPKKQNPQPSPCKKQKTTFVYCTNTTTPHPLAFVSWSSLQLYAQRGCNMPPAKGLRPFKTGALCGWAHGFCTVLHFSPEKRLFEHRLFSSLCLVWPLPPAQYLGRAAGDLSLTARILAGCIYFFKRPSLSAPLAWRAQERAKPSF